MTLANHLINLKKKKDALDVAIEALQRSPGSSSLEMTELKKSKLRLKEKITKIEGDMERLQNSNCLTTATLPEMTLEALEDNPEPEEFVVLKDADQSNGSIGLAA